MKDELWCAEIQNGTNIGNLDTLENILETNKRNLEKGIETGYYIIQVGTYDECNKSIESFKKKLEGEENE